MKILLIFLLFSEVFALHEIRNIQGAYTEDDFWTQWSSVNPRMSLFIKVTPQVFWTSVNPVGFTSNTRNMTLPGHSGIIFHSSPGITPTLVEQSLGEAGNLELTGIYQSSIFERTDILAGKWNFATVEVFSGCWSNTDLGEFVHFKGNIGEFKDYEIYFNAEGRGLIDRLVNDVNKVTQRSCRVKEFRDAECKHDDPTVTIDGTVYNIEETVELDGAFAPTDTFFAVLEASFAGNIPPENFYANGKMVALEGANQGVSREIAYNDGGNGTAMAIQLKRAFPFQINGDVLLVAGCRRTVEDCKKYANIANFHGEPFVPGIESANRIGSGN